MKKFRLYFHFFKSKFFLPLVFSFYISTLEKTFTLSIFTLILLSIITWFYNHYLNDSKKQKLYMYFNLGICELKLYLFTFFINLILLLSLNYLYR